MLTNHAEEVQSNLVELHKDVHKNTHVIIDDVADTCQHHGFIEMYV